MFGPVNIEAMSSLLLLMILNGLGLFLDDVFENMLSRVWLLQ